MEEDVTFTCSTSGCRSTKKRERLRTDDGDKDDAHIGGESEDANAYHHHSTLLSDHLLFGKTMIFYVDTLNIKLPDGLLGTRGIIPARVQQILASMKKGNIQVSEMVARCVLVVYDNDNLQDEADVQRVSDEIQNGTRIIYPFTGVQHLHAAIQYGIDSAQPDFRPQINLLIYDAEKFPLTSALYMASRENMV